MDAKTLVAATGCSDSNAAIYAPLLTAAFAKYGINTPRRQAFFLGQVVMESGNFTVCEENLNYNAKNLVTVDGFKQKFRNPGPTEVGLTEFADGKYNALFYEHKKQDIANIAYFRKSGNGPTDGFTYRGRGLIQLTGKDAYIAFKRATGIDVVANPDLLLTPQYAVESACYFWSLKKINVFADMLNVYATSQAVNGGATTVTERGLFTNRAYAVLESPDDMSVNVRYYDLPRKQLPLLNAIQNLGLYSRRVDPILLDLSAGGTGISTSSVSAASASHFDYQGTGFSARTGWASGTTGVLIYDPSNYGAAFDGSQLLGDTTELPDGTQALDGFQALQNLAGSGVVTLDKSQALWQQLKVWVNGAGTLGSGQFKSLDDLGVISINLSPTSVTNSATSEDNFPTSSSTFTLADGSIRAITDYTFQVNPTDTWETEILPIVGDIAALPEIIACGTVYDLSQAMARDSGLTTLIQQFGSLTTLSAVDTAVDLLLERWVGAEQVVRNSSRDFMDARHEEIVAQFRGLPFTQNDISALETQTPGLTAGQQIEAVYQQIRAYALGALVAQGQLKNLWGGVTFNLNDAGQAANNPNYDTVTQYFDSILTSNPKSAANELALFAKALVGLNLANAIEYSTFKAHIQSESADFAHVLDAYDGTAGAGDVMLGAGAGDVVAAPPTATGGYLFSLNDGGDLVSHGGNTLIGEVGYTKFVAAGGDTLEAVSQKGSVWFQDTLLLGGQWNAEAGGWVDAKAQYVYRAAIDASGKPVGDLTVSAFDSSNPGSRSSDPTSTLTIKNWVPTGAGNLGINLSPSTGGVATPFQTFNVHMDNENTPYFNSSLHYWDRSVAWYVDPHVQLMNPTTSRYNITLDNVLPGDVTVEAQPVSYSSQFSYGYFTDDQLSGTNLILQNNKLGTTVVLRDGADLQNTLLNKLTFADGTVWSLSDLFDKAGLGSASVLAKNPIQGSQTITESSAAIISRAGVSCDYHLGALSSNKTIKSFNANLESRDSIIFGSDVLASDLTYSQSGDDLLVTNTKQGSVLRVAGFLGADIDPSLAKGILFASGAVLSFDAVQALASAYGYTDTPPASVSDLWKTVVTAEDASGKGYTLDISAAEDAVLAAISADTAVGMSLATDFFKSLQVWDKKGMVDVRVFREHIIAAAPAEAYAFDVATQPPPPSNYYGLQNSHFQMTAVGGTTVTGGGGNVVAYGGGGADTFNMQQTSALQLIHAGSGSTTINGLNGSNEIIDGGNANDVIYTSYTGKAFVNSGKGDDVIVSTSSYFGGTLTADTTYFFARGFGTDTIFGDARPAPSTILFDRDIDFSEVTFTKLGTDLVINVADETGSVLVRGYFAPGNGALKAPVNTVAFADGVQLGYADVLAASVVVDPLESVLAVTRNLGLADDATLTLISAYGDVSNPGYGPAKQLEAFVAALTSALGLTPAKAAAFNLMQSLNALDAASSSYSIISALDFTSDQTGIAARSNADLRHALMAESPFVVTALGSSPAPYPGVVNESLDMPAQYWADRADILRLKLTQAGGTGQGLALGEQRHDTSGNPLKTSYSLLDYTATSFVAAGATPNGASDTAQFLLSTYLGSSLVGGSGGNHLYGGGTGYSVYLDGSSGTDNLFVAGPMYTTMVGGQGFNSFYARAHTFITNGDRQGSVTLSSAIDASKVGFAKSGNDLKVHVSTNAADDIVIKDWFGSGHAAGVISGGIQAQNPDGSAGQFWSQDDIDALFIRSFARGQGAVTWSSPTQLEIGTFGEGVTQNGLYAVRSGDDLILKFSNPGDSVTIKGWYSTPALRPKTFQFADGSSLSAAALDTYTQRIHFGVGDGSVSYFTPHGGTATPQPIYLLSALADVVIQQVGVYDLQVNVRGSADSLIVKDYFRNATGDGTWHPQSLVFADGASFTPDKLPVEVTVSQNATPDSADGYQLYLPYNELNPVTFVGNEQNTYVAGAKGDSVFVAGTGDEIFSAGAGDNIFEFGASAGSTVIYIYRFTPGTDANVVFDATISPTDIVKSRDTENNLILTMLSGKSVKVGGFFAAAYQQIDNIRFADGTVWTAQELEQDTAFSFLRGSGSQSMEYGERPLAVRLGEDIAPADLLVTTDSNGGLELVINGTGDVLDMSNWWTDADQGRSPANRQFTFADGTTWDAATIESHLVNMPAIDGSPSSLRATATHPVVVGFEGDNQFWAGAVDAYLTGGSGTNIFQGGSGNSTMQGGPGVNTFNGGTGLHETYMLGANPNENDILYNWNSTVGKQDIVEMTADITPAQVKLSAIPTYVGSSELNLVIGFNDRPASLTVGPYFSQWAQEAGRIDGIKFADGTFWNQADILGKFQPAKNAYGVGVGAAGMALVGKDGGDVLQAGSGSVAVLAGSGSSLIFGGTGDDSLSGGSEPSILIAGEGNNTVQGAGILSSGSGTGQVVAAGGNDVVLFNQGDGHAQVQGWSGHKVLSLGGGIDANDISIHIEGQDLVISTGNGDDVTISYWTWGGNPFGTLQIFEDASNSALPITDAVHSAKVAEFNLTSMGQALQGFMAADPTVTSLQLSQHLTDFLTSTSDTQAFGGDVAHFYAKEGALQAMDLVATKGVLADPTLGSLQQLHSLESLRSTHNQFQILGST